MSTVLLATHDFAIARTFNEGFLKASHSGLLKLTRLGGGNPLHRLLKNIQKKGDKGKQEKPHTHGFTWLNGILAKLSTIRLCRTSQTAERLRAASCCYTKEKTESLNTARAEAVLENDKTWAVFNHFNIMKDRCQLSGTISNTLIWTVSCQLWYVYCEWLSRVLNIGVIKPSTISVLSLSHHL